MDEEASRQFENSANNDTRKEADGRLEGREMLYILKAVVVPCQQRNIITTHDLGWLRNESCKTHYKLTKSSIACITANDNSIMRQTARNGTFFQIELGISAGLPRRSCRSTQKMNAGTEAKLILSRMMLAGSRMSAMSEVSILRTDSLAATLPGLRDMEGPSHTPEYTTA